MKRTHVVWTRVLPWVALLWGVGFLSAQALEQSVTFEVSGFANLYQRTNPAWVTVLSIDPVPVPGAALSPGQQIEITATGSVQDHASEWSGPDGHPRYQSWIFRGLKVYSLIGRWSTDPDVLDNSSAVGPPFYVGSHAILYAPANPGTYYLFLAENDGLFDDNAGAYTVTATWTVPNHPPVANSGGPYVAQATSWDGAAVTLDGAGSTDEDGDALTYAWDLDPSTDSNGDGNPRNDPDLTGQTASHVFPIGQTEIALVVTDEHGLASEADVTAVTVSLIEVDIDIKPGSDPNSINMGSNGVIPVAFLTSAVFDASEIDPRTVTVRGADFCDGLVKLRGKKDAVPMANLEDVDGDGDLDLVVQLETKKLAEYDLDAVCELGALTYDGFVVSGWDYIRVVPE